MGMRYLSGSRYPSRDASGNKIKYKNMVMYVDNTKTLPNPRPDNYKIIKSTASGRYLIVEIQYLDCTNYEGKKILVFKDCSMAQLKDQKLIDPHFSEDKSFHSPIARFEPTNEGWDNANLFVTILLTSGK